MKKEKMYVRMTVAALSLIIMFGFYLYFTGAFKERSNIRAYEKEEKTDTREPKDIYIGAEDDSGSEAGSESVQEEKELMEGETGEDPEEGQKDEGISSEDIVSYSLADEEELEDLRARRNEILRGKEKEKKEDDKEKRLRKTIKRIRRMRLSQESQSTK